MRCGLANCFHNSLGIKAMTSQKCSVSPPRLGEPYLLTPGPLTTAYETKEAMLRDWGSWDGDFRAMTAEMRARLLDMLGPGKEEFDCVPMQGSGTFAVEAMLGSLTARDSKILVLANGAYGQRSAKTLAYLGRDTWCWTRGITCRRAVRKWRKSWQMIRPLPMSLPFIVRPRRAF